MSRLRYCGWFLLTAVIGWIALYFVSENLLAKEIRSLTPNPFVLLRVADAAFLAVASGLQFYLCYRGAREAPVVLAVTLDLSICWAIVSFAGRALALLSHHSLPHDNLAWVLFTAECLFHGVVSFVVAFASLPLGLFVARPFCAATPLQDAPAPASQREDECGTGVSESRRDHPAQRVISGIGVIAGLILLIAAAGFVWFAYTIVQHETGRVGPDGFGGFGAILFLGLALCVFIAAFFLFLVFFSWWLTVKLHGRRTKRL